MHNRLKEIRKALKLTQKEFASKLGITDSGISRLEKGQNQLTDQLIRLICREYNIREEYLRDGVGKMFDDMPQTVLDELCEQYNLSELERTMIQEYLKLDESCRAAVKSYISNIIKNARKDDEQAEIDAKVAAYRRELELEKSQRNELSASQNTGEGEEKNRAQAGA